MKPGIVAMVAAISASLASEGDLSVLSGREARRLRPFVALKRANASVPCPVVD